MSVKYFNSGALIQQLPTYQNIASFNPTKDAIDNVDIMLKIPEKEIVLDQGNTGSCVAHSLVICESIIQYNRTNKWIDFDPYMIYGTVLDGQHDGYGMYPLDAINNCVKEGMYFKRDFGKTDERPNIIYEVKKFKSENPDLVTQAKDYAFSGKADIFTSDDVKRALNAGMPITATWRLYDSFENVKNDGILSTPMIDRESYIGNHQMTIVGIKNNKYYIVVNSYGEKFGFKGIYFIPFDYKFIQAYAISDTIIPTKYKAKEIIMKINDPNIIIDGTVIKSDLSPMIIDNRTMIPVRLITEALGASVEWLQESETIIIRSEEAIVKMKIGDSNYYVNNVAYNTDTAPVIINKRTLVPVRFISEAMNCKINWEESEQKLTIKCI